MGGFFPDFEAVRTALTEMLRAGVLYFCDLVQQAPPALRKRCLKLVANKAALCARFDAFGDRSKGVEAAQSFREDIESKIEKACEPPKAQKVKALPPPDIMTGKKKRGGRRVRKATRCVEINH